MLPILEKSEKNFTVTTVRESEILTADEEIIMEVADNLLANAFRYANQEVRLKLTVTPQYLKMSNGGLLLSGYVFWNAVFKTAS